MYYAQSTLLPGEQIILSDRPHWIVFSTTVFSFIVAFLFFIYGQSLLQTNISFYGYRINQLGAVVAIIFGLYSGIRALIFYKASEYVITTKRVLMKTGFIERTSLEIFLDKIEAVNVDQTISGRILDYGTITIVGTGGTKDSYLNINHPLHFRGIVQQEIDRNYSDKNNPQ